MKNIMIIFICLLSINLFAQNITSAEYFIDSDPGFGNGTQIPVTAAPEVTINYSVDLNTISDGFHVLYFRAKDDSGSWSIAYNKPFYKLSPIQISPDIMSMEYFIDSDPGLGNGENITVTTGQDVIVNFAADLISVDDGFHILYVRGKDINGTWSISHSKPFFKETEKLLTDITEVEYFFSNVDTITPVYTYTNFTAASDIDINIGADISSLARNTDFYFHITGKDCTGVKSIEYTHEFFVESTNIPPQVVTAISDINVNEDFGTRIIADLDTIFNDPDGLFGDSLRYSVILNSGNINTQFNGSLLQIVSVSDSNGVVPVIVRAEDDSLASVRDTFLVNIASINDAPVFTNLPDSVEFNADTSLTINIWTFVEDIETTDSLLIYDFYVSNDSLLRNYEPISGELTLSSNVAHSGLDSLMITVTDDSGDTAMDTMLVLITPSTEIIKGENLILTKYALKQNYPNPFNPSTTIEFSIPKTEFVTLKIYNLLGQEVATLVSDKLAPDNYKFVWDATNYSSGIYFYKLIAGKYIKIRKMILLK